MKLLVSTMTLQAMCWPTAFALNVPDKSMEPISAIDEARARLPRPQEGSPVLSTSEGSVAFALNEWTERKYPSTSLGPCESFSVKELNDILSTLVSMSNPFFQEIYEESCEKPSGCDKRSLRYQNVADFESKWQKELSYLGAESNTKIRDAVEELLRNGKCYEAAQIFHHHLSEEARAKYTEDLVVPLLPTDHNAYDFLMQMVTTASADVISRKLQYEDGETTQVDQSVVQETLEAGFTLKTRTEIIQELEKFIVVSPCEGCHRALP